MCSSQCSTWGRAASVWDLQTESGDRYVACACVVVPVASGPWSGRSTISPIGWTLGTGPNDRRVCRYTAALDGSGAVDANEEHPADYSAVDHALANQNFLVIKGTESCPAGPAVQVGGRSTDVFVNLSTAAHQP